MDAFSAGPPAYGASSVPETPKSILLAAIALFFGLALLLAFGAPSLFWALFGGVALRSAGLLVLHCPVGATACWLLVIGSTPEYWLGGFVGGGSLLIAGE